MTQAICSRPLTAEAQDLSQTIPYEIEVGKWFWDTFLRRVPPFSPASVIPPVHHTLVYVYIILIRSISRRYLKQILAYCFSD